MTPRQGALLTVISHGYTESFLGCHADCPTQH